MSDTWAVGHDVPRWIKDQRDYAVSVDPRSGDAFFETFGAKRRAIIVPRGGFVECQEGVWWFDGVEEK